MPKAIDKSSSVLRFVKNPRPAVNLAMINDVANDLQPVKDISSGLTFAVFYPLTVFIAFIATKKSNLINMAEKLPISPYSDIDSFNKTGKF